LFETLRRVQFVKFGAFWGLFALRLP